MSLGFPACAGPPAPPVPQPERHLLLAEVGPDGLDLLPPEPAGLPAAAAAVAVVADAPVDAAMAQEQPLHGLMQPVQGHPRRQQLRLPHGLPSELGPGLRLQLVQRGKPRAAAEDVGLRITCPEAHAAHEHPRACCKFRAFSARNCAVAGFAEPAGFLACWAAAASRYPSRAAHMSFEPSAADVAEHLAAAAWAQAGHSPLRAHRELLPFPSRGNCCPLTHRSPSCCLSRCAPPPTTLLAAQGP